MENDNQIVQSASSARITNRNTDGTIKVHCNRCHRWICDVDGRNNFFSAICAICQAVDAGEVLPKAVEDQLKQIKMPGGSVLPYSVVQPDVVSDPMIGDEPIVGTSRYWFKTVLAVAEKILPKKKKDTAAIIAKEKKRKPIFTSGFQINVNPDATHLDDE